MNFVQRYQTKSICEGPGLYSKKYYSEAKFVFIDIFLFIRGLKHLKRHCLLKQVYKLSITICYDRFIQAVGRRTCKKFRFR